MLRIPRVALAASLLAIAATAAAQEQQETVKATHGDWQIRCSQDGQTCVMAQTGKGAQGNDVVEVRIRKLRGVTAQDGSEVPAAIQVLTPLGVLLPAGVRVQVDAEEIRAAPYEVCGPVGCVVRQPMGQEFVDEMRAGSSATVTIVAAPQNEVTANISLSGFTRAFSELTP